MKRVRWKWFLPIAQLALALACHVYEPHEYRLKAQRDRAVNNKEYTFQNSPALAGRISQVVNFPALVLDYPLRNEDNAIYQRDSQYTLIWIAPRDIGFFVGIVLFWYLVGRTLDERQERQSRTTWPRYMRMAGPVCGVAFGILTGAYAYHMIASQYRPERQIGASGIAWSLGLIVYFTWRLLREFGIGIASKGV